MKNAKADASLYLITGLLQRLERNNPGLIDEMQEGVQEDRRRVAPETAEYDHICEIFDEAELLLTRVLELNYSKPNQK